MVQSTSSNVIIALAAVWLRIVCGLRDDTSQAFNAVTVDLAKETAARPLYCGLDVQSNEDRYGKLGKLSLPPAFWPPGVAPKEDYKYKDIRSGSIFGWKLPDKLHVTVRYFGPNPNETLLNESKAELSNAADVSITDVAFLAGGGLLCAKVELCWYGCDGVSERIYKFLVNLAPTGWRPHVTLATSGPWDAMDSTDVVLAMEKARHEREKKGEKTPAPDTWEIFSDVTIKGRQVELQAKRLAEPLYFPFCTFKYFSK